MLVSSYELEVASSMFPSFERRPRIDTALAGDPPAKVRLRLRIPHMDPSLTHAQKPGAHIKAILRTSFLSAPYAEGDRENPEYGFLTSTQLSSSELLSEDTVFFSPHSHDFIPFEYEYLCDRNYSISIEFFYLRSSSSSQSSSSSRQRPAGSLDTTLFQVLHNGSLDVPLLPGPSRHVIANSAELDVKWQHASDELIVFDIHVKIDSKGGWPFFSKRPFFVLYRWEQPFKIWTPIYRSEVLTRPSNIREAAGAMVFRLASLSLVEAIGDDDTRPLRLEFFQYKHRDTPCMFAQFSTSLSQLRQVQPASPLKLSLNIFPKRDLVGSLVMQESRSTAKRTYFALRAQFGGPVEGRHVYFALSVLDRRQVSPSSRRRKEYIFYTVSHFQSRGVWEVLYTSEKRSRPNRKDSRMHFDLPRIAEYKFSSDSSSSSKLVLITIHSRQGASKRGEPTEVGQFSTSFDAMLKPRTDAPFILEKDKSSAGTVKLNQAEKSNRLMCFSISFVLGEQ